MPIQRVVMNGKPGYRWGDDGKVYTYKAGDVKSRTAAKNRALRQGRAIEASRKKRKKRGS